MRRQHPEHEGQLEDGRDRTRAGADRDAEELLVDRTVGVHGQLYKSHFGD